MGKKSKKKDLGRALIKNHFGASTHHKNDCNSYLHSVDMQDGYDWGLLNLQSVTEESSFQEFLTTAELAGTEFQAEKLNIKFVSLKTQIGLLSKEKHEEIIKLQEKNKEFLKIPRRPKWDSSTTAYELQIKEREEFLEWRRKLALLQETEDLILTPYEKNLEFWRQLWRVIERSDVILQIVDARNPLLFRCEDLEKYVKEVSPNKINMILINKADFLTQNQREIWADYFSQRKTHVAFFSATLMTQNKLAQENEFEKENSEAKDDSESVYTSDFIEESEYESANNVFKDTNISEKTNFDIIEHTEKLNLLEINNSADLLTREELILLFKNICPRNDAKSVTTIGLVGYPNVGKSSTINALLTNKKVSVSATPGKTKHFQTLYLDEDLLLCDCPGLVMPSFVSTKAEMILYGILPINQMKDHIPSINLLGTLIPKHILENLYGIMIPLPMEGEDPERPSTAEEILNVYALNRGFMTQNGQPDSARSARYILKDFVNGKLLYCKAPPDYSQHKYHLFPTSNRKIQSYNMLPRTVKATLTMKPTTADLDKIFFKNSFTTIHVKGNNTQLLQKQSDSSSQVQSVTNSDSPGKPWKKINKHCNKKKREKTRRIYAHLDQQ